MPKDPIIPSSWSVAQANTVVDFIDELSAAIWARYGVAIAKKYYARPQVLARPHQLSLPFPPPCDDDLHDRDGLDDDIPW